MNDKPKCMENVSQDKLAEGLEGMNLINVMKIMGNLAGFMKNIILYL